MTAAVPAQRIDPSSMAAASWEDQERLAPPGSYQAMEVRYQPEDLEETPGLALVQLELDVNCPGCGRVFHLRPPTYTFTEPPRITVLEPIHFTACCGWRGGLVEGIWRPVPL